MAEKRVKDDGRPVERGNGKNIGTCTIYKDERAPMYVCLLEDRVLQYTNNTPEYGICDGCGGCGKTWHGCKNCAGKVNDGKFGTDRYWDKQKGVFRPVKLWRTHRGIYYQAEFIARAAKAEPLWPGATERPLKHHRTEPIDYVDVPMDAEMKRWFYRLGLGSEGLWMRLTQADISKIEDIDGEIDLDSKCDLSHKRKRYDRPTAKEEDEEQSKNSIKKEKGMESG